MKRDDPTLACRLFLAADPALDEGTIGLVSFKVEPDGKIEILDAVKVTNVGAGLDLAEQRRRVAALVDRVFAGEGVAEYLDRERRRYLRSIDPTFEAEPRGAGPRIADAFEDLADAERERGEMIERANGRPRLIAGLDVTHVTLTENPSHGHKIHARKVLDSAVTVEDPRPLVCDRCDAVFGEGCRVDANPEVYALGWADTEVDGQCPVCEPGTLRAKAPDPLPRATFEPDPRIGQRTNPRDPFTADTGPRVNAPDDEVDE